MAEHLTILIRRALKNARENGYDQSHMTLDELASDLVTCDSEIEKYDVETVAAELKAIALEEELSTELNKFTGQELLDFSKRVRSEGMMAIIDVVHVERSIHPDYEKQSASRVASIKSIIADSIEFVGKYKIARDQ